MHKGHFRHHFLRLFISIFSLSICIILLQLLIFYASNRHAMNTWPKYAAGEYIKSVDEKINTSTIDSWVNGFSEFLGKPWYPHAMRHAFTTSLLEQNLPEALVQMIIGWSSSDMVRLYDDRSTDSQLDKYFGEDGIKQVESKSLNDL